LSIVLAQSEESNQDSLSTNVRIAVADLLTNLCGDSGYCLLLVYELDEQRPNKPFASRHSGAVHLAVMADEEQEGPLKLSLEALVHNVSWSDPAGKRAVQKVGVSNFLHTFIDDLRALDN
jgi:hypothetical protein